MADLKTRLEVQRGMLHKRAELMLAQCEREQRALTADEDTAQAKLLTEIAAIDKRLDAAAVDADDRAALAALDSGSPFGRRAGRTIGPQFAGKFEEWWRASRNERGQRWESPSIEFPYATLLHGPALHAATLSGDPASGGDLVVPDYRPGVIPVDTRRLVVADLFAQGTTESNLISYMKETAFTNAADTVAEGATKPESTLTFDATSDPVRKIAHWLPVTEEMLEDVPALASYIDTRLRLGVQLTEDDQLLNGTTVAPDIVGILHRTGLAPALPVGTDVPADVIAQQVAAIATNTGTPPDGIVMHPNDWLTIQLMKTPTGEYVGDGPFVRPIAPTLWGLPVAVTPAIAAGTALVGCFKTAAQIFRKGGIRVAATNAHLDYFTKNLVAIRAEERLALAVYRAQCFGLVTGLVVTP